MQFLILETNCENCAALIRAVNQTGNSAVFSGSQEAAQRELLRGEFDAVFMAVALLGARPFNLAEYIRLTRPHIPLILLQGPMQVAQTWQVDVDAVLEAPLSQHRLCQMLRNPPLPASPDPHPGVQYLGKPLQRIH